MSALRQLQLLLPYTSPWCDYHLRDYLSTVINYPNPPPPPPPLLLLLSTLLQQGPSVSLVFLSLTRMISTAASSLPLARSILENGTSLISLDTGLRAGAHSKSLTTQVASLRSCGFLSGVLPVESLGLGYI